MIRRVTTVLTILALLALGYVYLQLSYISSRGGDTAPLYSNKRYDPYGTAALRTLLEERGNIVTSLQRHRIDPNSTGVLIQVLANEKESEDFIRQVRFHKPRLLGAYEWIQKGNTCIILTRGKSPLLDKLGVTIESSSDTVYDIPYVEAEQAKGIFPKDLHAKPQEINWIRDINAYLGREGADPLPLFLRQPGTLQVVEHENWRPLAMLRDRVVAAEFLPGRGRLIVVTAPTPALNHGMGYGGNLDFLLSVIGDRRVIMDEWSHGLGHGGTVMELIRKFGLLPFLIQVAVTLGFYSWSSLGHKPSDYKKPARKRSSAEQIDTLGYLYQRSLSRQEIRLRVCNEVRRRLAGVLRVAPGDLEKLAPEHGSEHAKQILELLSDPALGSHTDDAALVGLSEGRLEKLLTQSHNLTKET